MYAYPAGTSFCSCASSRAVLHVRLLFPWNRQPSNAPPLLLSPTGCATRRGPLLKNTLGGAPRPRRTGTPARKGYALPERRLNGASRLKQRNCKHQMPLPRSGGGAVWVNNCLFKFQSRQRDFLRLTPRQIAVLAALRCPKKSSRCSLARFFRPLRVLRLAASATGGARLRTPVPLPRGGGGAVYPNSCLFSP